MELRQRHGRWARATRWAAVAIATVATSGLAAASAAAAPSRGVAEMAGVVATCGAPRGGQPSTTYFLIVRHDTPRTFGGVQKLMRFVARRNPRGVRVTLPGGATVTMRDDGEDMQTLIFLRSATVRGALADEARVRLRVTYRNAFGTKRQRVRFHRVNCDGSAPRGRRAHARAAARASAAAVPEGPFAVAAGWWSGPVSAAARGTSETVLFHIDADGRLTRASVAPRRNGVTYARELEQLDLPDGRLAADGSFGIASGAGGHPLLFQGRIDLGSATGSGSWQRSAGSAQWQARRASLRSGIYRGTAADGTVIEFRIDGGRVLTPEAAASYRGRPWYRVTMASAELVHDCLFSSTRSAVVATERDLEISGTCDGTQLAGVVDDRAGRRAFTATWQGEMPRARPGVYVGQIDDEGAVVGRIGFTVDEQGRVSSLAAEIFDRRGQPNGASVPDASLVAGCDIDVAARLPLIRDRAVTVRYARLIGSCGADGRFEGAIVPIAPFPAGVMSGETSWTAQRVPHARSAGR